MPEVVITLRIETRTPLSIGAGGSSGSLAAKSILRDGWGRPIIPASHIKGKARHAAEALARMLGYPVADIQAAYHPDCVIQPIFGAPLNRPSPLRFGDLPLIEPGVALEALGINARSGERAGHLRPSVAINRRRGVAEDERLLIQEAVVEYAVFSNERAIVGELGTERELALLLAALRLTTRWGSAQSRGMGWALVRAEATYGGALFDEAAFERALRMWQKE